MKTVKHSVITYLPWADSEGPFIGYFKPNALAIMKAVTRNDNNKAEAA